MSLLTKSSFTSFLESPLRLWLERVRPDLLPPIDPALERIFEQGHIIDDLARGLYPGGVEVLKYNEQGFINTRKAIQEGAKILYQPTAVADGLSARGDILTKEKNGKWDIHEVKSSTEVKDEHLPDLAFQRICFESAGIPIGRTFLVHVNNEYVRHGEIEIDKLLVEEDVTDDVLAVTPQVEKQIPAAMAVLGWPRELGPAQLAKCADPTGSDVVIEWLNALAPAERERLLGMMNPFGVGDLIGKKISVEGLSEDFMRNYPDSLPETRWPLKIDERAIREEISRLEYPLYFYDYETYASAVPAFDGYRPYQQVPFQFSLSVVDAPGAKPRVFDFLKKTFEDPSKDIINALKEGIGPKGTLISWNASFENGRNKELAAMHPESAEFLLDLNERTYDLMLVFKKGMYVHPGFHGSASLKKVLPVVVPTLSYKVLNIQQGGEASASWLPITDPKTPKEKRDQLIHDEIEYCRLDVLAMVRILDHLYAVSAADKITA